ncbi:hypothetical protein M8542_43350 [Amycolatopsis sp. OK19-0408]|uniref:DUF3592 domain-containing protein n=1 Tax=Amycolatopsis iheyensis TaxID=2945988 RepID=A0A9X2SR86_9PSEU|nr:hypothetical protein [Amycolatopsis iheyensis]MCR6489670.1 hypothetical protein [Amycolatopsis iheyensis]
MTAGGLLLLVLFVASLFGIGFLVDHYRDRAGSVVAPATVERLSAVDEVVALVGDRYYDVRTSWKYDRRTRKWSGPGYVRGSHFEVRYWPHEDRIAQDTAGEVWLPGSWAIAIPFTGAAVGFGGLVLSARRSTSSSA